MKTKPNDKSIKKYVDNIKAFAKKHGIDYTIDGTCGFGRPCVGLLSNGNYIDYNPTDSKYEYISEFYDKKLYDILPKDAYHKHNCIAVLGTGNESVKQLSEWIDKLNELSITIEEYETGNTGIQALLTGITGKAVKIKAR